MAPLLLMASDGRASAPSPAFHTTYIHNPVLKLLMGYRYISLAQASYVSQLEVHPPPYPLMYPCCQIAPPLLPGLRYTGGITCAATEPPIPAKRILDVLPPDWEALWGTPFYGHQVVLWLSPQTCPFPTGRFFHRALSCQISVRRPPVRQNQSHAPPREGRISPRPPVRQNRPLAPP